MKRFDKFCLILCLGFLGYVSIAVVCNMPETDKPTKEQINRAIPIYAEDIIDMLYAPDTKQYYIEYCDPDCFDMERYGDYIVVNCSKEIFFDLLEFIDNHQPTDENFGLLIEGEKFTLIKLK